MINKKIFKNFLLDPDFRKFSAYSFYENKIKEFFK